MRGERYKLSLALLLLPLSMMAQADVQPLSGISVMGLLRGLLGLVVLIGIAYIFSSNRKAVSWKLVGAGLLDCTRSGTADRRASGFHRSFGYLR